MEPKNQVIWTARCKGIAKYISIYFMKSWFALVCHQKQIIVEDMHSGVSNTLSDSIQFNSQGIIGTGYIGKVPKNCPKSVQNRQKRGLFIKNGKYRFKIWFIHSFQGKIQFKGIFNIIFFRNIQFKNLFNNIFSRKIQFKNLFKIFNLAGFISIKYSFN